VQAQIDVKPSYGLGDAQIAQMLQDSFSTAEVDMRARALVEARVDADRLIMATQTALRADGDLLSAEERSSMEIAMRVLLASTAGDDAAAIEAHMKAFALATESFAAMRMNRGIAQALAGKNIQSM
jgi:molecular chaperone HscA